MGVYDYVDCEYPLPGLDDPTSMRFQSKDTDAMYLERYTITKEGRLIHHSVRYEDHSDHTKEGLEGLAGIMTPIPDGDVDMNYHGSLNFYGTRRIKSDHEHIFPRAAEGVIPVRSGCWCGVQYGDDEEWFEYDALFSHGVIVAIERVNQRVDSGACAANTEQDSQGQGPRVLSSEKQC